MELHSLELLLILSPMTLLFVALPIFPLRCLCAGPLPLS